MKNSAPQSLVTFLPGGRREQESLIATLTEYYQDSSSPQTPDSSGEATRANLDVSKTPLTDHAGRPVYYRDDPIN